MEVPNVVATRNPEESVELHIVDIDAGAVIATAYSMGEVRRTCHTHGWNLVSNRIEEPDNG